MNYLEALLRVYNLNGRRDNKYKSRIKILVNAMGMSAFRTEVETEYRASRSDALMLTKAKIQCMSDRFFAPASPSSEMQNALPDLLFATDRQYKRWHTNNTLKTRHAGLRAVYIALKEPDRAPGDITAEQMDKVAELADQFSSGQIRTTHTQNLLLPFVPEGQLQQLYQALSKFKLATPAIGTTNDIICCPGLEFCSLANTHSIPIANEIHKRFVDPDLLEIIGAIQINISGCMNACGHHHVGNIGILGVDKKGKEWFQVTLGGSSGENARLGDRLGPALARSNIVDAIETVIHTYLEHRLIEESFLTTYSRIGIQPFKEAVYG